MSGMIVGTLFTLLVVPSIYMLVARTREAASLPETPETIEADIESLFETSHV